MAELIIKPIEKYTKNFNTWYVSLDSELNRVPISALKFDRSKIYINDSINLSMLGTISDMVPIIDENRLIVSIGLNSLKKTKPSG